MRMFNPSGDEILVDKAQIPALEKAGWTKNPPEVKEESEEATDAAETQEQEEAQEEAAEETKTEEKKISVRKRRPAKK